MTEFRNQDETDPTVLEPLHIEEPNANQFQPGNGNGMCHYC